MVKKPFALCFFDDGNLSTYADQELMSKKDIFSHLEDSAMNKDIALHVLDVSVTRDNNGNITGAISIDNEASRYTTMLFNKVFANYTPKTPPTDNTDKTIFMAEGIGVVIYMGYYTGIRKWDQIVKKLEGVIDSISFSFQQSGTPQMVLAVSDSYTFMGNPRMQNTELTMQPEGTSDPDNYTPLRSAYPYTSNAKRIEVEIATDRLQEITSGGEASTDMSGGGTIGGGQTYAGDTAPAKVVSSAAQSSNPRKKTTKFAKSKYLPKFNIFAEEYGVRDSQAVLLIAKRYNDMIDALYPIFEVYPMYLSEADAQLNQKMRDRLKIKNTFVCMTGEGGNRYSIMSAFHPRVRDNKVAHPVNMGFSDLLLSLASKHHFDVFVRNRCLFFIPPLIKRTPDFTYYYGATEDDIPSDRKLLSFEPSLTSVQLGVDFHSFEFNPDNGMVDFIRTKFGKDLDKCTVFLVCIDSQDGSGLKYFEVKGDTVGRTVEKDAFAKLTPLTGSQYISKSYFSSAKTSLPRMASKRSCDWRGIFRRSTRWL